MNEPRPVQVGDILGQYQLVELLAIGGMGLIYRGHDRSLDRPVAVKVLAPELARDPETSKRFLNEARAAATFNHPNVVHVYSAGEQAGTFYFVMELVKGQHIEALLARPQGLSIREAVSFIRQAALGLQHAHDLGLIHGDVKPANFIVTDTGVVKVTDFGLARRVKAGPGHTDGESLFGTPAYISPEVIAGHAPDLRSDLYSLGATFYQMLTGQPPFVGATPDDTLRLHAEAPVPNPATLNPKIPANLQQIVARMLSKNPAARFQSYSDLIQALDRHLTERTLGGAPVTGAKPATKPAQPKRESTLGVIFTVLAVVASLILTYFFYRNQLSAPPPAPPPRVQPKPTITPEQLAKTEFNALKSKADLALAAGQPGAAYVTYNAWPPTKYTNTTFHQAVADERANLLNFSRQRWAEAATRIAELRQDDKLEEALSICAKAEKMFHGIPEVTTKIAATRRELTAPKPAPVKPTVDVEQLRAQLATAVTGLQWEKALQAIPPAVPEFIELQTELTALLAMRQRVADRLKASPGATITLSTKLGELSGQVVDVNADQVTIRQPVGTNGFADVGLRWDEMTAASVCRVYAANIAADKPDELFGYAVLIVHQALAQQARPEDARKTIAALLQLDSSKSTWAQRYIPQLGVPETPAVTAPAPKPVEPRQSETGAAALWSQIQIAATSRQWAKVYDTLPELQRDFGATEFVKAHAAEIQALTKAAAEHAAPAGFSPVDLMSFCNADFICQHPNEQPERGFLDQTCLTTESYRPRRRGGVAAIPDDGNVAIDANGMHGTFQLRANKKKDAIALGGKTSRYSSSVTVDLPTNQQRRYARLALLTAANTGAHMLRVTCNYQVGQAETKPVRVYSWLGDPPAEASVAISARTNGDWEEGRLFQDFLDLDPKRNLKSVTFTWDPANGDGGALPCIGIFAVSLAPAGSEAR